MHKRHSLSTSSMMVTSLVPMLFVALQMYSPESCRPTDCSTKLLFTTLCLQGRVERSLDHITTGEGNPTKHECRKLKKEKKISWISYILVYVSVYFISQLKAEIAHITHLKIWVSFFILCSCYRRHHSAESRSVPPPRPWAAQEPRLSVLRAFEILPLWSLLLWSQSFPQCYEPHRHTSHCLLDGQQESTTSKQKWWN